MWVLCVHDHVRVHDSVSVRVGCVVIFSSRYTINLLI